MFNQELNNFKHDFEKKMWALLYLHDWDTPTEANPHPVWPEIHGIYEDEQTAIDNLRAMVEPSKYHIRVVYQIHRK